MLTLRARIFAISSVVILIILAIVIGLIVWGKRQKNTPTPGGTATTTVETPGTTSGTVSPGVSPEVLQGLKVQAPTTEAMEKNAAKQLAKVFIERYGSYSTDNDWQNIRDVEGLVTSDLWGELSKKLTGKNGSVFVGVTTKAIAATVTDWTKDKSATVNLQVNSIEERSGTQTTVQKSVTVNLEKVSGQWLVSAFSWNK